MWVLWELGVPVLLPASVPSCSVVLGNNYLQSTKAQAQHGRKDKPKHCSESGRIGWALRKTVQLWLADSTKSLCQHTRGDLVCRGKAKLLWNSNTARPGRTGKMRRPVCVLCGVGDRDPWNWEKLSLFSQKLCQNFSLHCSHPEPIILLKNSRHYFLFSKSIMKANLRGIFNGDTL